MSRLRILGLAASAGLCAGAALWWWPSSPATLSPAGASTAANAAPCMVFNPVVSFDAAEDGQLLVAKFPIHNRGGAELVVDQFRPSCNCAGMGRIIDGQPKRIDRLAVPPYETVEIEIRLHAEGEPGKPSDFHVLARTNDPEQPEIRFTTRIQLLSKKPFAIPREVVLGRLDPGAKAQVDLSVIDPMRAGKKIIKVEHTMPGRLEVKWEPARGTDPRGQIVGHLNVATVDAPAGPLDGAIHVHFADTPAPMVVRVSGRRAALVEAVPDRLLLPRQTQQGLAWHGTINLRVAGGPMRTPIEVEGQELPPGVSVEMLSGHGPSMARVKIKVEPEKLQEARGFVVRLRVQAGSQIALCEVQVAAAP